MIPIKNSNEDGYILIFVLIVTSILLTLGTMTITIAQTNYKMKQLNSQVKKSFYIIEALIEESEIILYDYVGQASKYSYDTILENQEKLYQKNYTDETSINKKINELFKQAYVERIGNLKNRLEDTNNYSIKTIEGYSVTIKTELKKCIDEEAFNLYIVSTVKDKKITEKIKTQYKIVIPDYMDYNHNKQLVIRVDWMNYKW